MPKVAARKTEFATALRRLVRGVGRLERDVVCCDVTLQQFETLRLLQGGPRSLTEVARALGIDLSTASRNVAKLEAAGYIERVAVPDDARATANQLTRKGTRCVETLVCDERVVLGSLLSKLPVDRRELAVAVLSEVSDAVDAELAARDSSCTTAAAPSPRRRARESGRA